MIGKNNLISFVTFGMLVYSKCVCEENSTGVGETTQFKANEFECIDDTRFRHYVDSQNFFIKSCSAPGLCFTRTPPSRNPCIGKTRAEEIDN